MTGSVEAAFYKWLALSIGITDRPLLRVVGDPSVADIRNDAAILFFQSLPPPTRSRSAAATLHSFVPDCPSIAFPFRVSPDGAGGTGIDASRKRRCGGPFFSVEMANLIEGYSVPCLMDVKIGVRIYGDDATAEKKQRMIQKAQVMMMIV